MARIGLRGWFRHLYFLAVSALLLVVALRLFGFLPALTASSSVVIHQKDSPKFLALTFDDGPKRRSTPYLLDGLAERGVKATFFLVGSELPYNEDIVLRIDREGHQIGIHTYDHMLLTGLNQADFDAQIKRTKMELVKILGRDCDFPVRPPYGEVDESVLSWADAPIVLWSVDPEDWEDQNADREVSYITRTARDGDIILMHDIFPATVDAALRVVDSMLRDGYLFLTIDELFFERRIPLEKGSLYRNAYP